MFSCGQCEKRFFTDTGRDRHFDLVHKEVSPASTATVKNHHTETSKKPKEKKDKVSVPASVNVEPACTYPNDFACSHCEKLFATEKGRDMHCQMVHKAASTQATGKPAITVVNEQTEPSRRPIEKKGKIPAPVVATKKTDSTPAAAIPIGFACSRCKKLFPTEVGRDMHYQRVHNELSSSGVGVSGRDDVSSRICQFSTSLGNDDDINCPHPSRGSELQGIRCVDFFRTEVSTIRSLIAQVDTMRIKAFYGETVFKTLISHFLSLRATINSNPRDLVSSRARYGTVNALSTFIIKATDIIKLEKDIVCISPDFQGVLLYALLWESFQIDHKNLLNVKPWLHQVKTIKEWMDKNIFDSAMHSAQSDKNDEHAVDITDRWILKKQSPEHQPFGDFSSLDRPLVEKLQYQPQAERQQNQKRHKHPLAPSSLQSTKEDASRSKPTADSYHVSTKSSASAAILKHGRNMPSTKSGEKINKKANYPVSTSINSVDFACSRCEKRFTTQQGRDRHREVVHNNGASLNDFACSRCERRFPTEKAYAKHFQTVHDQRANSKPSNGQPFRRDSWRPEPPISSEGRWVYTGEFQKEKSFGYFICGRCSKEWFSAHSYPMYRQGCQQCERKSYPLFMWENVSNRERDESSDGSSDSDGPHDQLRCEKCQTVRGDCRKIR
jgi:hypothetical protein